MPSEAEHILDVLDRCCDAFTFPMLNNGYVYLAATRLSLYRTAADWAMVIEVFGFSPRSGLPDTHIHTFASTLYNRDTPEKYAKREAYDYWAKIQDKMLHEALSEEARRQALERLQQFVYQHRLGRFRVECRVMDGTQVLGNGTVQLEVVFKGRFSDLGLPGAPPA